MRKDSDSWSKDFSEKLSICEQENNRIMNSTTFCQNNLNGNNAYAFSACYQ